jgi:fucose permease
VQLGLPHLNLHGACAILVSNAHKEKTMRLTYRHTLTASYLGYVTQAIINNLAPLLFLTFQREWNVSLADLALLISLNFIIQIAVDLIASVIADKVGYRAVAAIAHVFCVAGLIGMGILPRIFTYPYAGLVVAACLNAVGGGLIEVIISPIVESLPGDKKAASMSLLHSFYCWGHVAVVVLSTVYFALFGVARWPYLVMAWALVPLFNFFLFIKVPLRSLNDHAATVDKQAGKGRKRSLLMLFLLMMVCAGAAEQAMSQWASLFAEAGLGVSKTMGDLLGPCLFALLMGLSRVVYGVKSARLHLEKALFFSSMLCIVSYLLAVFSPVPLLSLLGCGLCGLSVGLMWPGTFSIASKNFPRGGTAMFAFLALAGDVGCSVGPGLVGSVSNAVQAGANSFIGSWLPRLGATEAGLKTGLFLAIVFPLTMLTGASLMWRRVFQKKEG